MYLFLPFLVGMEECYRPDMNVGIFHYLRLVIINYMITRFDVYLKKFTPR